MHEKNSIVFDKIETYACQFVLLNYFIDKGKPAFDKN